MNVRLRNAYVRIADSTQSSVAPVGIAWKYVRDNYPTINLYQGDGSHPSAEGTYLAACTFYASVFRKSPVGASYLFGLDPTVAANLQNAAALSVLDSLNTWHLRPKEDITIADFHFVQNSNSVQFLNDSWRAVSYEWDFGDLNTGIQEDMSHAYSANGTYTVRLVAMSDCGNDTVYQDVTITSLGIEEQFNSQFKLKTLADGKFELAATFPIQNVLLVDLMGREIDLSKRVTKESEKTIMLELGDLNEGVYFLQSQTAGNRVVVEIPLFK
jgi:PKD repeat protein